MPLVGGVAGLRIPKLPPWPHDSVHASHARCVNVNATCIAFTSCTHYHYFGFSSVAVTSPITSTPRLTFTSWALNHFRTVIPRFRPNILSRSSPGQRANKVFHYYCGSRNSTEWNLGHYRLALCAPTILSLTCT